MNYFFDTYALVEIVKGNENYLKYAELPIITTTLNLSEFYFFLLQTLRENEAEEIVQKLSFSFVEIDVLSAKEAAIFRKKNYKRQLSYADCIGYVLSKKKGFTFLTGDDFFEHMEHVAFVR